MQNDDRVWLPYLKIRHKHGITYIEINTMMRAMGVRGKQKPDPYQEALMLHEREGFESLRPTVRKESIKRGWHEIAHPHPMAPQKYGVLNDEPILVYTGHAFRCDAYRVLYDPLLQHEIARSTADTHLCLANMGEPFVSMDDVVDIHMCRGVFARMKPS